MGCRRSGLIFGLCIDQSGLFVLWTSHHNRTTAETFLSMQNFTRRPEVRPLIEKVFLGSGDEELRFANGGRILYGARERGVRCCDALRGKGRRKKDKRGPPGPHLHGIVSIRHLLICRAVCVFAGHAVRDRCDFSIVAIDLPFPDQSVVLCNVV